MIWTTADIGKGGDNHKTKAFPLTQSIIDHRSSIVSLLGINTIHC